MFGSLGVRNKRETMMRLVRKILPIILGTAGLGGFNTAQGNVLLNGDFETGTLANWTTFITSSNGRLGPSSLPDINTFDVSGSGPSQAARFQVGEVVFVTGTPEGGGIFQSINVGAGTLSASANIAAWDSTTANGSNLFWGLIELLIDATVVDSTDFGHPPCCDPVRDTLSGSMVVGAGSHEIRLRLTRPSGGAPTLGVTPFQYIDNVVADIATTGRVAEPASFALLGLGLAGLGFSRRKNA
jgi:hypothetical protein